MGEEGRDEEGRVGREDVRRGRVLPYKVAAHHSC